MRIVFIDRLAHVVDRQQCDRDAGKRFHLHSGLRRCARGALYRHAGFITRQVHFHVTQPEV